MRPLLRTVTGWGNDPNLAYQTMGRQGGSLNHPLANILVWIAVNELELPGSLKYVEL